MAEIEEFLKDPSLDEDYSEDVFKANLYLAGIIGAFIVLTFIAYLLNEGRHLLVIPILRKIHPKSKWVLQHDRIESEKEDKLSMQVDLQQHARVFGMKKGSRSPSLSRAPSMRRTYSQRSNSQMTTSQRTEDSNESS